MNFSFMILIILIIMILYKYHFNINNKYISLCLLLILIINELYFKKNMSLCKNCIYERYQTEINEESNSNYLDSSICDLNSYSSLYTKQKNKLIEQNTIFKNITKFNDGEYNKYILNINNDNLKKFNELSNNNNIDIDKCELPCHLINVDNNIQFNSENDEKKYKDSIALKCEKNLNLNNPNKEVLNKMCLNYSEEECNDDYLCNFNKNSNKCESNQKKCIWLKTDNKSLCKNKCEYNDTEEQCNMTYIDFKNNLDNEKYCIWDKTNNKCKSLCNKYSTCIGCNKDNNCKIENNKCINK